MKEKLLNLWKNSSFEKKAITVCLAIVCFFSLKNLFRFHDSKESLFYAFRFASDFSLVFALCHIYDILRSVRRKNKPKAKRLVLLFFYLIFAIPSVMQLFNIGNTQIGSFFEKREYTENYIVCMSRDPNDEKNRKEYYLPATISRYPDVIDSNTSIEWYSGERYDTEIEAPQYHLYTIYFENGGYLTFEDDNIVIPNKEVRLIAKGGDFYYVTLTKRVAK